MPARPWRAKATTARTAERDPRAPAAIGRAASTRTTPGRARARRSGLAGVARRPRFLLTARTVPANRARRRGEPVLRRSARRDTRAEHAAPGWPASWARGP